MSGVIGAGRLIHLLYHGAVRWEERGVSAGRIPLIRERTRAKTDALLNVGQVSTVGGGVKLRRRARSPECPVGAGVDRHMWSSGDIWGTSQGFLGGYGCCGI